MHIPDKKKKKLRCTPWGEVQDLRWALTRAQFVTSVLKQTRRGGNRKVCDWLNDDCKGRIIKVLKGKRSCYRVTLSTMDCTGSEFEYQRREGGGPFQARRVHVLQNGTDMPFQRQKNVLWKTPTQILNANLTSALLRSHLMALHQLLQSVIVRELRVQN